MRLSSDVIVPPLCCSSPSTDRMLRSKSSGIHLPQRLMEAVATDSAQQHHHHHRQQRRQPPQPSAEIVPPTAYGRPLPVATSMTSPIGCRSTGDSIATPSVSAGTGSTVDLFDTDNGGNVDLVDDGGEAPDKVK